MRASASSGALCAVSLPSVVQAALEDMELGFHSHSATLRALWWQEPVSKRPVRAQGSEDTVQGSDTARALTLSPVNTTAGVD